jgi:hypothetical protein
MPSDDLRVSHQLTGPSRLNKKTTARLISGVVAVSLFMVLTPNAYSAVSLKTTYISKLKASLKVSWAQKYMGSEGFQIGNKFHLTNSAVIDEQIKQIKLVCALFDAGLKEKKSSSFIAKGAAAAILSVESSVIDVLFNEGSDEEFIEDFEFVKTSAISVGVGVYCKKYSTPVKNVLVPEYKRLLIDYLYTNVSILDEPAADHFVTGSALVTLTQVWRISLNGPNGPKSLREVTDEIYEYLASALGRYPNEQDITVGFQPGNSMHSIFTRLVYDQEAYDAIKQRLIYNANN